MSAISWMAVPRLLFPMSRRFKFLQSPPKICAQPSLPLEGEEDFGVELLRFRRFRSISAFQAIQRNPSFKPSTPRLISPVIASLARDVFLSLWQVSSAAPATTAASNSMQGRKLGPENEFHQTIPHYQTFNTPYVGFLKKKLTHFFTLAKKFQASLFFNRQNLKEKSFLNVHRATSATSLLCSSCLDPGWRGR